MHITVILRKKLENSFVKNSLASTLLKLDQSSQQIEILDYGINYDDYFERENSRLNQPFIFPGNEGMTPIHVQK